MSSGFTRKLAITDVETTGRNCYKHEIVEIGLIVADQMTLQVLDIMDVKVKPTRLDRAEPIALEVNGYTEEAWQDAVDLKTAMLEYAEKTKGAIFCAHNVIFDWGFIDRSFYECDIENPLHYLRFDTLSIAWSRMHGSENVRSLTLKNVSEFFGVEPEPDPHRGIHGAICAYHVLCKIHEKEPSEVLV